jgi:endonuclease/exonuclease/phosphatase family metal-dependent hydrolase
MFEPMAWLCVGNFNEILEESEKLEGARRPQGQMEDFKNVLDHCCLSDLGYWGPRYTWTNKRTDSFFTQERLDRAVANATWCGLFPLVLVEILATQSSDHAPICVTLCRESNGGQR